LTAQIQPGQRIAKRIFDLVFAVIGLTLSMPIIIVAWLVASLETRANGLFFQPRVGQNGIIFRLVKIKTMKQVDGVNTSVTTKQDPRITVSGRFMRKTKIDELPQFWNVLVGNMSFVGPRPDVTGYADKLVGQDRVLLCLRPGLTGPATLKYRNEEAILASKNNPELYNDEVIWPDKVRINLEYIRNYSFRKDLFYIWKSVVS